jgi:hypothetical protein
MKRQQIFNILLALSGLCLAQACSNDKLGDPELVEPIKKIAEGTQGTAEYFDLVKVHTGYILVNDAQRNSVYLMDKEANLIHNWNLNGRRLGNDAFLLPDGKLLAMLEVENPSIDLGGFGGLIQLLDKDGNVEWNFEYSSEDHILHHDAELLPNGNILTMIWERKSIEEAQMAGSSAETELIVDGLIEIDPNTDEIVWEWHMWDHLVQEHDSNADNFGEVGSSPNLVDINFVEDEKGDITHANGIAYDPDNDVIYLSVNFFSEVWVIDHSTTTLEAASHAGGSYNKGGDILYRFGNPKAYKNDQGTSRFDRNHFPNLLDGQDKGNMLIFANGATEEQSTVYELKIPQPFSLQPDSNNEPEVVWSFTDEDLFARRVSGAVRLPNGNTLITEGDFGIWEVTNTGQVVWQFSAEGFFWRAYSFETDSPGIQALNLP